jgi:hypothetical protein
MMMMRMTAFRTTMLLTACLAACSPKSDQAAPPMPAMPTPAPTAAAPATPAAQTRAPAPDKQHQAWMAAIFGTAYDAGKDRALVIIEGEEGRQHHLMTLASSSVLPDGRVAVVVNGMPSDRNGQNMTGRGSGGLVNVYIVRADGSGWQVLERGEHLASLGSDGMIGAVDWVMLGPGKPGFTVSSSYYGQGTSVSASNIFELGNGIRPVGNTTQSSNNNGACYIDTDECWDFDSSTTFATTMSADGYSDLLMSFKGKRYRMVTDKAGAEVEQTIEAIDQDALYRFNGTTYALASGSNPIGPD